LAKEAGLPASRSVVIQGFGNAGQFMAKLMAADGDRIIAVSDSRGAIRSAAGLPVADLIALKARGGSVTDLAGKDGIEAFDPNDVIAVECDVLVPAAMENMIDEKNADRVRTKVIVELANGPI